MDWTQEQLSEVREFAAMMMEPREIAVILQVDPEAFVLELADTGSDLHAAFQSGYLATVAENNRRIVTLAKQGSSPAQNLVKKMEVERKLEEIKHGYR